jgi:DNA mismatch repair protein MutS2
MLSGIGNKKSRKTLILRDLSKLFYLLSSVVSGERGIQTPGTLQYGGFQDRCNRSLCHLSRDRLFFKGGAKIRLFPKLPNDFSTQNSKFIIQN